MLISDWSSNVCSSDLCVQEMPALERLHLALADGGLAVLAISQDRGGEAVVAPFLERLDLQHLPIYLDAKGELGRGRSEESSVGNESVSKCKSRSAPYH